MSTFRGRPPCVFCLAGGIIGSTIAHCSSVRSDGYFFLKRPLCTICAYSYTDEICANYLINLLFCQAIFPDSLLVKQLKIPAVGSDVWVDVMIGQAQFGEYTVTLYDQSGKNPQRVGVGN